MTWAIWGPIVAVAVIYFIGAALEARRDIAKMFGGFFAVVTVAVITFQVIALLLG